MAKRFSQIFWGLLLVLLDLRINNLDILPDFIGCAVIALGCNGLNPLSPRFAPASLLAWMLTLLALLGYVMPKDFSAVSGLAWTVVDCLMMWLLLGGVMEAADGRMRPDLSKRASSLRVAYVGIEVFSTGIGWIADAMDDAAGFVAILIIVCTIVVVVMILQLIRRMMKLGWDEPFSSGRTPYGSFEA